MKEKEIKNVYQDSSHKHIPKNNIKNKSFDLNFLQNYTCVNGVLAAKMPTGGKDWWESLEDAEEGINGIAPGTLIGFLLDSGTKAAGKDIGTGSFSKAQYTKNMAWTQRNKHTNEERRRRKN